MSKPRPFVRSFSGIVLILIIAVALLWANNYRTHRAGFNLPFDSVAVIPVDRKSADSFQLVTSADAFAKLAQTTQPASINWDKQLAFVYFAPVQTSNTQVRPQSVHRDGAVLNINYQLVTVDQTSHKVPGIAVLVDRTKLISSSDLLVNLLQDKTIIRTLKVNPNQI